MVGINHPLWTYEAVEAWKCKVICPRSTARKWRSQDDIPVHPISSALKHLHVYWRQKKKKKKISGEDSRNGFLTPAFTKDLGSISPSAGSLATWVWQQKFIKHQLYTRVCVVKSNSLFSFITKGYSISVLAIFWPWGREEERESLVFHNQSLFLPHLH